MTPVFKAFFFAIVFAFASPVAADGPLRILTMGDSMMATHKASRQAVSHAIGKKLRVRVLDRSVSGARIIYNLPITGSLGLNIAKQYKSGNWDWIVLNGGGNDLLFGCGCRRCGPKMNRLIAKDGNGGEIPKLIRKLRRTGAQVIYVGYLRSPGVGSPIEQCRDEGAELESRISRFAARDQSVHFVSLADMVPTGDRTFHTSDMVHPSHKGSKAIGARVAEIIAR